MLHFLKFAYRFYRAGKLRFFLGMEVQTACYPFLVGWKKRKRDERESRREFSTWMKEHS